MHRLTGVLNTAVSLSALACSALSSSAMAQDAAAGTDENADQTIIVTGVFGATAIEDAPISISVITSEELEQLSPASAADILKSVPGVFVNSSLGEIRNVVFSRGVSANSLDGAGGYYYISLQEDGLPVEPLTQGNYGPDYFSPPRYHARPSGSAARRHRHDHRVERAGRGVQLRLAQRPHRSGL